MGNSPPIIPVSLSDWLGGNQTLIRELKKIDRIDHFAYEIFDRPNWRLLGYDGDINFVWLVMVRSKGTTKKSFLVSDVSSGFRICVNVEFERITLGSKGNYGFSWNEFHSKPALRMGCIKPR
jgi:hypothetical protein